MVEPILIAGQSNGVLGISDEVEGRDLVEPVLMAGQCNSPSLDRAMLTYPQGVDPISREELVERIRDVHSRIHASWSDQERQQELEQTSMVAERYDAAGRSWVRIALADIIPSSGFARIEVFRHDYDPILPSHPEPPSTCNNCTYYHGKDGINCAVHPCGVEGDECSDWWRESATDGEV